MDVTHAETVTLVINAGGTSLRMGRQKALLPVPSTGLPLIVHVMDALQRLGADGGVVVANDPNVAEAVAAHRGPRARCVPDDWPGAGPLGGIATGLVACRAWAAVVACDMPLVSAEIFVYLMQLARQVDSTGLRRWDAVVPVVGARMQTMHALYHRDMLPVIEQMLTAGELRVRALFSKIRVRYVGEEEVAGIDPGLASFINVNTPEEWAAVQALLSRPSS